MIISIYFFKILIQIYYTIILNLRICISFCTSLTSMYAFFVQEYQALTILTGIKTITILSQIYSGHSAWFLPKNTPYTTKLSNLLTRLRETGILYKFFIDHFPPSDNQNQVSFRLINANPLKC